MLSICSTVNYTNSILLSYCYPVFPHYSDTKFPNYALKFSLGSRDCFPELINGLLGFIAGQLSPPPINSYRIVYPFPRHFPPWTIPINDHFPSDNFLKGEVWKCPGWELPRGKLSMGIVRVKIVSLRNCPGGNWWGEGVVDGVTEGGGIVKEWLTFTGSYITNRTHLTSSLKSHIWWSLDTHAHVSDNCQNFLKVFFIPEAFPNIVEISNTMLFFRKSARMWRHCCHL